MSFFIKDSVCARCNETFTSSFVVMIKNGVLCQKCGYKCADLSFLKTKSVESINDFILNKEQNQSLFNKFKETRSIGDFLIIDDNNRLWHMGVANNDIGKDNKLTSLQSLKINTGKTFNFISEIPYVFSFEDVLEYELIEDGNTVTKGGLGAAIVGGITFGGAGAVTGAVIGKKKTSSSVYNMRINITINNQWIPFITIVLLNGEIKKGGFVYNNIRDKANVIVSTLSQMCLPPNSTNQTSNNYSLADELLKFKQLLDSNIITIEEFESIKSKLLNT